MPDYTPTTWTNGSGQPINATNLTKIENALDAVEAAVRQGPSKKVKAATTASITLSGTQTIDTISCTAGDRVLVKNQATASQNGIYIVAIGGWSRADDADDGIELTGGTLIHVALGTANGGKVFKLTNSGSITVGTTNLVFEPIPTSTSIYATNGTTPLKYSAFLEAAGGNHNTAFQNAITALFTLTTSYDKHLDLEGATVQLTAPVTAPTGVSGGGGTISITNGEITAETGFSGGDHMLVLMGDLPSFFLRMVNVLMNGKTNASWIKWDIGNLVIEACQFKNPKPGTNATTAYDRSGLYCSDGGVGGNADAGFWINNCWFATDEGSVEPTSRWTVGILSQTGDNKIGGGTTMSYFRHSAIFEAPGIVIHGFHPFQGRTPVSDMTNHTASLKFTNGRAGAQVSGLYLGKSFMEISNESNTAQTEIGEIAITNMRAFMENAESGAAHIVVRDYSGASATATVTDISITNSQFINGGSVQTLPTKLHNPAAFNRGGFKGIVMQQNTFETTGWNGTTATTIDCQPQANPVTLVKTFAAATAHAIDFGVYLPFGGRVKNVISVVGKRSSGTSGVALDNWTITTDTVDFVTAANWAGDITATVSVNNSFNSGFLNG